MTEKLDLNNLPDLLKATEIASIFRVSLPTVKRWGNRGELPFLRINSRGDRRIRKEEVLKLLSRKDL